MKAEKEVQPPLIVFVANELGNFRHHREHLVKAAQREGMSVLLLASEVGTTQDIDYEYRPIKIQRFRMDPRSDLALFWKLLRLLVLEKPDIIHLINIKPYLFGGLAAKVARLLGWKGRVVMTVPGLGRLHDRTRTSIVTNLRRIVVELLLRMATPGARVTFETMSDAEYWLEKHLVSPDCVFVSKGTGIDLSKFVSERNVHIHEKCLSVLYAGRLLKAKGLDVYLHAAKRLHSDQNIRMLVAGFEENDPDAISVNVLRSSPGIIYLGAVSDMPSLLSDVDVVVLPSRYNEGIPRILLEAFAAGCVSVATRFAGSENLIEDGKTGFFLTEPPLEMQADQLVSIIYRIQADPELAVRIGDAASKFVRSNGFSSEEVVKFFVDIYRSCLEEHDV